MKIMRNDVRASKEANEMSIYIYRVSKGRNRVGVEREGEKRLKIK